MTLSGSGDVRPPCRPRIRIASGFRMPASPSEHSSGSTSGSTSHSAGSSPHCSPPTSPAWERVPGSRGRTGPGCTLGNRCGCEYGRARLPDIGIMDVGYRMHTRCACLARSSVPGIRPSASIRCQLSGARYPGPETRHPYRIPIPGRKAGIPAHALKKHAHGVCIMGDRAKGGDRISSICISNLNKAVGTLWMHPVRGPKIQTWKGLRTLSCGDGKGR
jgi:hypothetical protein